MMIDRQWLKDWLRSGPRVGDGAMGTMLQRAGLPLGACPEVWNLERPEDVRAVHAAYREAGAELLQTNSFGANRVRLRQAGLADRVAEINAAAVRLAREVAEPGRLRVAGTIGPTGERLEPAGDLSAAAAMEVFGEQAAALAMAGADLLLIETMTDVAEAVAAVQAARAQTSLPVVATMTFGRDGRTLAGGDPAEAALRLAEAGAAAVGANCAFGPASLLPVITRMRAALPALPLVAQPSCGLPRLVEGQPVYDLDPPAMAAWARRLVEAGASLIGACCGSTPDHVQAIREALRSSP